MRTMTLLAVSFASLTSPPALASPCSGMDTRTFTSPLSSRTSSVTHEDETFAYRVVGPEVQPDASREMGVAGQLRVTAPLRWGFYAGAELELGGVESSAVRADMMDVGTRGLPSITPGSAMMFSGVGVLGVSGRVSDRLDIGVEVAGGGRGVAYSFDSHYGACETSTSIIAGDIVGEGRVRGTAWLSAAMSLTLFGGRSFVDDGMVGGVSLGFTNQPYGKR
jgi:hypothetical protein